MTVTITTSGGLMSRYGGPTFDCGGAQIRAHCHHLATVVTIRGRIDAANVDRVSEYTRRFILARGPLIVDLSGINSFAAQAVSLVDDIAEDCRGAGVEWTLVAGDAVSELLGDDDDDAGLRMACSARDALRHFADVIATRRELMLPLIKKTA